MTDLGVLGSTISWLAPTDYGATSIRYDTLRTGDPADFLVTAIRVESDVPFRLVEDDEEPAPGGAFFYVIRARNDCPSPFGFGTIGSATDGTPRAARTCP